MKTETVRVIEGQAIKRSLFEQLHKQTTLNPSDKTIGVVQGYALVFETEHGALGWIHWLDYMQQAFDSVMPKGNNIGAQAALATAQQIFFKDTPQLFLV